MRRADQGYQSTPQPVGAQAAAGEWMPPREDLNSPDLYIPGRPSLLLLSLYCRS